MGDHALSLRGACVLGTGGAVLLRDVDWQVPAGDVAVIVGRSGSGKSQLLRVFNRLNELASGSLEILGRDVRAWSVAALRRRVGWVPQRPQLGQQTAEQALLLPQQLGLVRPADVETRRAEATSIAGLDESLLGRPIGRLSGGERHRVALARALLLAPEVLLLDEPSSALDGESAAAVLTALLEWRERSGATLVVVTHRIEDVRRLGGHMLVLDQGRVVRAGRSTKLLADPEGVDVHVLLTGRTEDL